MKNPDNFDLLGLDDDNLEREIKHELTTKITGFSMQLGEGFSFVSKEYKVEVSETDFVINLLFCHIELECYVMIDVKADKIKSIYTGKFHFYVLNIDIRKEQSSENDFREILRSST